MRAAASKRASPANLKVAGLLVVMVLLRAATAAAQPGPSFSVGYELFPHGHLADPDTTGGNAFLTDGTIRIGTLTLNATYPLVYSEGRTVLVNELAYRRFDLDYLDFPQSATNPENMQALEYSATVTYGLSQKWTLMGILKPGIASDFEGGVGRDDLTFQVAAVFIRAYSQATQVGYGLAWANTFGQPFPLPVLAVNWSNGGRVRVSTLLPANLEIWYGMKPKVEVGLRVNVEGNQYHGDRDIYRVANPLLRYSLGTVGPSLRARLGEGFGISLDSGFSFQRRFEFFNGDDEESLSDYSLKNAAFLRVALQYGE